MMEVFEVTGGNIDRLNYQDATAVIVCFDVTKTYSLERVESHWKPAISRCDSRVPVVLAGNKVDLRQEDCVTRAEGFSVAERIAAAAYVECSAKSAESVDRLFTVAATEQCEVSQCCSCCHRCTVL